MNRETLKSIHKLASQELDKTIEEGGAKYKDLASQREQVVNDWLADNDCGYWHVDVISESYMKLSDKARTFGHSVDVYLPRESILGRGNKEIEFNFGAMGSCSVKSTYAEQIIQRGILIQTLAEKGEDFINKVNGHLDKMNSLVKAKRDKEKVVDDLYDEVVSSFKSEIYEKLKAGEEVGCGLSTIQFGNLSKSGKTADIVYRDSKGFFDSKVGMNGRVGDVAWVIQGYAQSMTKDFLEI